MLKYIVDCETYFNKKRYYLLEKKLDRWDGVIKTSFSLPGATIHVVSKPEEMGCLCADGYDLRGCPNLEYMKGGLVKKALLIFAFVGKRFAHSTLIAMDDNIAMFDSLYKDVKNKSAGYIGLCYTDPLYRGEGLYPFVLSRACRLLKDMGKTVAFINTKKTNEASLKGILKAGFEIIGEVEMNKILFWKQYKKVSIEKYEPKI